MKSAPIDEQQLRDLVATGAKLQTIASHFGVSKSALARAGHRLGLVFQGRGSKVIGVLQEDPSWLAARVAEGLSVKETQQLCGATANRLRKLARAQNLKFATKQPPVKRRYAFDEHFLDVIDSEAKAYMLGLFAADGCISSRHETRIKLHERDEDILIRLRDIVGYTGPLRRNGVYCTLSLCSTKYIKALASYGIGPRKSLVLPWPDIPDVYRCHFMRGVMDGDGSIGRQCRLVSGSPAFIEGFAAWYKQRYGKEVYRRLDTDGVNPKWRVVFNRGDSQFIYDLYADATVYMKRKYQRFHHFWQLWNYK